MSDVIISVKALSANPTKTVVKTRTFEMIIDEPRGTNEGASPVEYLLASLAGCLNAMGHMVAREMNINLRGIEIQLTGKLNPDKSFGKETSDGAGYKEISVEVSPDTDADRETLDKWLETVESRCPVSDTLNKPTPVQIKLK